jgi:tetratricopeptide (TPR) repeat protein
VTKRSRLAASTSMVRGSGLFGVFVLMLAISEVAVAASSPVQLLKRGDYRGAIVAFKKLEARKPQSFVVKRGLGFALLKSGDAAGAVVKLQEAHSLKPDDPSSLCLLGDAAEQTGQTELALQSYGDYLVHVGPAGTAAVRARIQALSLQVIRAAAREAIRMEKDLDVGTIPANTIAVPEFAMPVTADSLRPLARGLALALTTDLSQVPGLVVVERARLRVLLDEARINTNVQEAGKPASRRAPALPANVLPFARKDAPRVGKLVGARRFVQGNMVPTTKSTIVLNASVADVASAAVSSSGPAISGPITDVLNLEKSLVFQILDHLGIELTPELRARIGTPPTRSYAAFQAFCRGLDFEDRGMPTEALEAYQNAVRIDPSFSAAASRGEVLGVQPQDQAALQGAAVREVEGQDLPSEPSGTKDRLLSSGEELGLGPGPDTSPNDTPSSVLTPTAKTGPVLIRIRGTLR